MTDVPKIKRNIQRMIDQNAPESDIDAYVASEGVTAEQLRAHGGQQAPQQPQEQPQEQPGESMPGVMDMVSRMSPYGMGQQLYRAAQNPMGALQTVDDSVRMLANGATFGYADKIAGYMGGDGTEAERAKSAQASERLGPTGPALEIGGSMIPGVGMVKAGMTAMNIPKMWKPIGAAIDGSLLGGLTAAGHDENIIEGASMGGLLGTAGNALGKGAETLVKSKAFKAMREAAPSFATVKATKDALYNQLDNAGVKFDANAYAQTLQSLAGKLKNYRATRAPMTADTVQNLIKRAGDSPTFRDIEDVLSEAKGILREKTATDADKSAAGIVLDELNRFFDGAPLMTNGTVPADQIAPIAKQARDYARRHIVAKQVKRMQDKSEWYLGGEESGLRNQFSSYGKYNAGSMSDAEKAAAQSVVKREGALGLLNQSGSRLGQVALGSTGLALGGLPAAGVLLGGNMAARKASEALTKRSVDKFMKTALAGRTAQGRASKALTAEKKQQIQMMVRTGLLGSLPVASFQNGQ
jgi:hypothetical protein